MKVLFGRAQIPGVVGELLMPIHQLPPSSRLQILEMMTTFTARGLEGEASADAAPMVEEDPLAKYLIESEGDEDDKPKGASSSRAAREDEVLEISSSDDEEFLVAHSHPVAEGGEQEGGEGVQKAGAGRREGCSKKKHEKPAGSPAGTPLKRKAEAAPEGASGGGIASRLRCSMQWVDTADSKSG